MKTPTERVNITLPIGLMEKAHALGINVSKICTNCVQTAVDKMEHRGEQ